MVRRNCSILFLAALLAACGGSDAEPQPAPPPANAPPSFTSPAAVNAVTGATGTVYTATATDPNNDPLTYSISGGADQTLFQITNMGRLTFRTPPDLAAPADQDRNNVYLVQLRAADAFSSATLDLAITVTANGSGFRVRRVATGFDQPVFLAPVPGSDRVFVVERAGLIRILDPVTGTVAPTQFLNVTSQTTTDGERGLLGFVTARDYATSGQFYVFLTNLQGAIEIRRYTRSAGNPDVADASTADVILAIPHPNFSNHYGGWIGIGPDDLLYIATGDGGGGGDPDNNAQNPNSLLGKILRIDPRGDDFPADPNRDYRVPVGNPTQAGGGAREIIALGLRNPFRASFDEAALYIGDVGQGAIEEVDLLDIDNPTAVTNFGWPILEGTRAFRGGSTAGLTPPVLEYSHGTGPLNGNTVTGGLVYRGPVTSLQGSYIFADFIRPRLWSVPRSVLTVGQTLPSTSFIDRLQSFAPNAGAYNNIVSFGIDRNQNLYILDFDGEIFVLEPVP